MRFRRMILWTFAAASLALSSAGGASAPIPPDAAIAPDPAVKQGTMPNGLRYAVMRNSSPARGVSIRLIVKVGSYDETDAERGIAHFIEHMAFRSTRQAPAGILDNRFARLGIALGRDQNAATGIDSTTYSVDLPTDDPAAVRTILDWMRAAADGILFTDAAVDIERNVVLAERNARQNPLVALQREVFAFQAPTLRSANRDPIGTDATLRAATPALLKAFYERWYRPDNAMLVVVGDAPAEELESDAIAAFSGWTAKGARMPRPAATPPGPARALEAFSSVGASYPWALSACRLSGPDKRQDPPLVRVRRELDSLLWTSILNRRLAHLTAQPESPVVGATALVNRTFLDASVACLIAVPADSKWRAALQASQSELRRFAEAGPTETEVEETIETLRSRLRAQASLTAGRASPDLADGIIQSFASAEIFTSPDETLRVFDIAAAGMTPADVMRAFEADWTGDGPLLSASAPSALPREELLAAWRANEGAPLEAYADRTGATWRYKSFGKRGKVRLREKVQRGDFIRFHFKNGTILNYKQTPFQKNSAEVRVRFGQGERALAADQRLATSLAAGFFPNGGLGRMSFEEISSAFANTTWGFSLDVHPSSFILTSSPMSSQVYDQLQLLTAYMTDPGFRSEMDDKLPTAVDFVYRLYVTEPAMVAQAALEKALYPDKPSLPPREQMVAYRAADFDRLLRPVLTAAPVEVTIVGDIGEEEAVEAMASSFGALPPRARLPGPSGESPFRRFPETLPPPIRATHEGPAEKAAALLVWPLYTASPERRREEYAIEAVASIFQTRLLQRIRGELGKVYSPTVGSVMPDHSDQGFLAASIEATPADIAQMVAAARQIAADLVAGKISQRELDEARLPSVAARVQAQSRNEPWAAVLSLSVQHPDSIEELTGYQALVESLTLDEVRAAARTWLGREPVVATSLPAEETARP